MFELIVFGFVYACVAVALVFGAGAGAWSM